MFRSKTDDKEHKYNQEKEQNQHLVLKPCSALSTDEYPGDPGVSVSSSGVEGGVTKVILDIRSAAMAQQHPAALVVPCLKIVSEVQ